MKALAIVLLVAVCVTLSLGQGLSTTVLCSEVACSDGWICQNACSSWCGLSEPTEARPVCNPKSNTGDAPPPTVPANRCNITDCGFRSVDFVACPSQTTYSYKYAGTSCVRQTDGSCRWELAECQTIPSGPCSPAECGPEPAPPANAQIVCTGNYVGTSARYECNRDSFGQCRHQWIPCQVGCKVGMVDLPPFVCAVDPCAQANLPPASIDCDPSLITQCQKDYCGGCNRRYYDRNNNEICVSQTRTCANIVCEEGYRCYEGATLGIPECRNTLTCDNVRCNTGEKCEMQGNDPVCVLDVTPFVLNCANVQCSSFHNCVEVNGLANCVPFTGACSSQECATRPTCWDNSVASGGSCNRLASGKCVWTGTSCPVQPNPPPTNAAGDSNCLVSAWTSWSCSATTCGGAGVQIRSRTVTQAATGTGQACPDLIERGTTCVRTCTQPPPVPANPPPVTSSSCAGFPTCDDTRCSAPGAASCTNGVWVINGNTDISSLSYIGCATRIVGNLNGASTSNLRIHACAPLTVTGTASLAGRLSLDVYNTSVASGLRVVVVNAQSVSGTFSSTMVTGFSVADGSVPFRPGYSNQQAYVDFGTTTPPPTTTTTTTGGSIVPTVVTSTTTSSNPPPTTSTNPPPTTSTNPPPTTTNPPPTTTTNPPPTTTNNPPPTTTNNPPPTTSTSSNPVTGAASRAFAGAFAVVAAVALLAF